MGTYASNDLPVNPAELMAWGGTMFHRARVEKDRGAHGQDAGEAKTQECFLCGRKRLLCFILITGGRFR